MKSHSEIVRRGRFSDNEIKRRKPKSAARRKRLEADPEKWLRYYFPNIFTLPFSDGHRAIIKAILLSDRTGKNPVVAAPRGEGCGSALFGIQ